MVKESDKIIIKAKGNPFDIGWKEILASIDLLYFLTWRDIKVRYKQTLLGILWIILQPLVSMVIFTIIFGKFAKIPSDNVPYPIFVFIGLMFWNFFSATLTAASNSLVSNENIIKKVYFPRILAPLSSTLGYIVDLIPTLLILTGLMVYYKVSFTLQMIILLPFLFLLLLISALGAGMFLAPINAKFRDVRLIIPYFIQLAFFITPVVYPTSLFGGTSKIIRVFNPVAEAIEVSRSSFFGIRPIDFTTLFLSILLSFCIFLIGLYFFRSQEDKFIDIL